VADEPEFTLPEDLAALSAEELAAALEGAVRAFDALSNSAAFTTDDLAQLRTLAAGVDAIRTEQAARVEAAEQAAAEIDALAAQVRGDAPTEDAEPPADAEPEPTASADNAEPEAEPDTTASARPRRTIDLSSVRRRQPSVLPPDPNPRPEITASVDVPGYSPGQALDMEGVTEGIIRRANALKTAGGGVGLTASYRLPFDPKLIVNDSSSGTEGTRAVLLAGEQSRLQGGNLVASGGWCAPSETVYTLTGMACPEMLWDLPEIQLARGGLRYFPMPALDVSTLTWVHTEADDIAGNPKPCFKIPCPDPIEVRCEAIGACLESGILTQRHFPELVAFYQSQAMIAHEIRIKQELFSAALAASSPVTIAATFGAFSALFAAVALQAADITEKLSLCQNISIEVVFPWWSKNLMLADIARQNGVSVADINVQEIITAFAQLGISIQWARGLNPAVPDQIGGTNPATTWPDSIPFLIYPAGTFEAGRGGEISLGVIHDKTQFSVNDFTALFTEECTALIARNSEARIVTVPVCPDGRTGEQLGIDCPIA
jgi:hypothetical protein